MQLFESIMFGKITEAQKAAMKKGFAAAISAADTEKSELDGKAHLSDNESVESKTDLPSSHDKSLGEASEVLRINVHSESVEISNIRLFALDEIDFTLLTRCTSLSLRKNLIHVLSPLPIKLANRLNELDFFDNKIKKVGDFFESALVETTVDDKVQWIKEPQCKPFSSLTKLDLSYNQIRVISGLDSLGDTLKELYLVENKIKVIQGLGALRNLELLELGGNHIREIGSGLENLVNLRQLWLGKNKIVSIGNSLRTLRSLELLSLQANRILLVEPECFTNEYHPSLRELYLSENGIRKIENICLANLRTLDFSFNPIERINEEVICCANMPILEEFWLTDGKISEWGEVQKLAPFKETLRTVYLERNPIEQDRRYRNKVYLCLPFLEQIDSWPVVNIADLEMDRKIERDK
ncbi:unnamed protein product [Phytomonas sp. EM1]|nr:unnamed protein product [Phytomonas sp. EM1]|eukprot:CCW61307.1 unnamed protein product [Phytomonas sp. isolate EM1]